MGGIELLHRPGRSQPASTSSWTRLLTSVWPALLGGGLGLALFALARNAMPDDALITLSFARNVAEQGCWCLSAGLESNTATSPLNVWLLAGVIWLTGHAFWAAAAVLAGALGLVGIWMRTLGGNVAAVVATVLIAASPVFGSAVGMETALVAAVLVGLTRYVAQARWLPAGALVAASWLTRPDTVIPAVVIVVLGAALLRSPRLLAALPLGAVLTAPWAIFSWWHFGSAWANSVAVKWANGSWGGYTLTDLSFFLSQWPVATAVTVATMAAGGVATGVAVWRRQDDAVLLGGGGLVHLSALSLAETPPIFYYIGPSLAGLGLALVLVTTRSRIAVLLPTALVVVSLAVLVSNGGWWERGIPPIRQNWATNAEYAAIAAALPSDGVVLGGEVGGLAFYCHTRCRVVDPVLSDPGRTDVLVSKWRRMHPSMAAINYRYYEPPPMIPVRYRLQFGNEQPGPGPSWPITRNPGLYQWATLETARDPFQVAN